MDGFTQQAAHASHTVQAPLANFSQSAALGPSLSTAQYAFNIGETVADYVVTSQHRCVNHQNGNFPANPECSSFGRIIFTPSFDVLLTADMSYDYFMPTDPMSVGLNLRVISTSPAETFLQFGDSQTTTIGGPQGGTFALQNGTAILPAGRTITVQYSFEINYFGGANNLLGVGDGAVHLTMTAVPEPATLGLLVFAALLIRTRSCRELA